MIYPQVHPRTARKSNDSGLVILVKPSVLAAKRATERWNWQPVLLIANTLGWSEQEEPEDPKELVTFSQSYLQKPFATFASHWPCLLNELNYNKFIMLASAKLIREWVWTFREGKNCNTETNQWKKFSLKEILIVNVIMIKSKNQD